jgi:hypothetical protein
MWLQNPEKINQNLNFYCSSGWFWVRILKQQQNPKKFNRFFCFLKNHLKLSIPTQKKNKTNN